VDPRAPLAEVASPRSCTKGLVFHGARDFYDLFVPGGGSAVAACAARANPELGSFFSAPKLAGGWYDVMPIVPLSRAASELLAVPHAQLVRDNAAWLARRDLHGVYRFLLRLASIESVAMRLPALSMRYFDFGGADGRMIGPNVMESSRFGIPAALVDWFQWAVEGFTPVALTLAGARQVKVLTAPPPRAGAIVTLRFRISWG
jgi:hypothetical protein